MSPLLALLPKHEKITYFNRFISASYQKEAKFYSTLHTSFNNEETIPKLLASQEEILSP
jgi:hypothetical protein